MSEVNELDCVDSQHLADALATLGNLVEIKVMTGLVGLDGVSYYIVCM